MQQKNVLGKYEYLEHPADIKIRSCGKSLEHAISNMVCAMSATFASVQPKEKKKITISAPRLSSAIYDFFSHSIVLVESDRFVPCEFKGTITKTADSFIISGDLFGETVTAHSPIKAVTYHEISIETQPEFALTLVFDI